MYKQGTRPVNAASFSPKAETSNLAVTLTYFCPISVYLISVRLLFFILGIFMRKSWIKGTLSQLDN